MSNGDWSVPPQNITAPPFAGPADPSITFGPDPIPPELVTYGAAHGITFLAAMVWRYGANAYAWEAIGDFFGLVTKFEGTYDTTNGVYLTARTLLTAPPGGAGSVIVRIGAGLGGFNAFPLDYQFIGTNISLDPDSDLHIAGNMVTTAITQAAGFPNGNTNSGNYADVPGMPTATYTKQYATTRDLLTVNAGCFVDTAAVVPEFAIQINGVDYSVTSMYFNQTFVHAKFTDDAIVGVGTIPTGAQTCTLRWRILAGAGIASVDGNDRLSFTVREVTA